MPRPGFATSAGTRRYADRFPDAAAGHFRSIQGVTLSGIGIGTYLGEPDDATDDRYRQAIRRAAERGANVIDTASNYRFQRSERAIGRALVDLEEGGIGREELFIATKGGYLPFDGSPPPDFRRYVESTVLGPGLAQADEIVQGHCLAPRFIQAQLAQSRHNLGVASLDAYYLHNAETQLSAVDQTTFESRLRAAFATLEQAVADGTIGRYGLATWNGFRAEPGAPAYHRLARILALATEVGGPNHHFGIIQLPFNLVMHEALSGINQDGRSILAAAADLGLIVMTSASILQAQLARSLPPAIAQAIPSLGTDAQRALQITRSALGVTTALVGMSRVAHVEENLQLLRTPPLASGKVQRLVDLVERR